MTTKHTIEGYFEDLKQRKDWQSFLADDMVFTRFASPIKQIVGKGAFLESTKRFYGGILTFDLRDIMTDGDKACALTRYQLQLPDAPAFQSDVAEIFRVRKWKDHFVRHLLRHRALSKIGRRRPTLVSAKPADGDG